MFDLVGHPLPVLRADWSPVRKESLNNLCPFSPTSVNGFFEKSVLEQRPSLMADVWIQGLVPTPGTLCSSFIR